ncbi:hypothetical protein ACFLQR_02725 [Verrucomicrobiota bacterium]
MIDHVEEIRKRRRQLMREKYGTSVGKLVEEASKWERKHPTRIVDLRGKHLTAASK